MRRDATVDAIVSAVAPTAQLDEPTLERLISGHSPPADVVPLISSHNVEIVRAAVLYLGVYGAARECPVLALCLHHADREVVELAERGLWSIWMQSGAPEGNRRLAAAVASMARGQYGSAVRTLSLLIATEPGFAEAHFQLGIALSSLDRNDEAARAYREALRLNPYHFGAAAALGHVAVEQGNLDAALRYYQQAQKLHPRIADVPDAVRAVRAVLGRHNGQ